MLSTLKLRAHFGSANTEIAKMLEWEFKKFVALTLLDKQLTFAPSGPVDMYWHFLILHTKEYREFCDAMWGSFQHHPRGSRMDSLSSMNMMQSITLLPHEPINHESIDSDDFQNAIAFYQEIFGKPDPMVWCHPHMEIV